MLSSSPSIIFILRGNLIILSIISHFHVFIFKKTVFLISSIYLKVIKYSFYFYLKEKIKWWAHPVSNQGPAGYEPAALPAELWARQKLSFKSIADINIKSRFYLL